jgi:tRNA pseudouridine38-40 synthase
LSSSDPAAGARRWRLEFAYDGSGLFGVADQPGRDTVVGRLRESLSHLLGGAAAPSVVVAGRTDAGVHAMAQVAHVDLPEEFAHDGATLVAALNSMLAPRVRVLRAAPAPDGFHARFSATWRAYRYLVVESAPPALALSAAWSWAVAGPLDLAAMRDAAARVVGEHDFRSFCRRAPQRPPGDPIVREVFECDWSRLENAWTLAPDSPAALRLGIRANAFCHHMVRSLVSTMVAVGRGHLPPEVVTERLGRPERAGLPGPAPAGGLALIGVGYPELAGGPCGSVG